MWGSIKASDITFFSVAGVVAFAGGIAAALWGYWILLLVAVGLVGVLVAGVWRRTGRNFGPITAPTVTPNLALIALPTILASSAVSIRAGVYATALAVVLTFWIRPPNGGIKLAWPCAILPAAAFVIVLRPNYPSTAFTVLFFVLGSIAIVRAVQVSESKSSALVSLIDGMGLFSVASIVLWLAGFNGVHDRTAGLENSLTGAERVIFPLSSSLAATPGLASVYIAAVIPILIVFRQYRFRRLIAVVCAGSIFVLTDSRVSLVGALVLVACVLLTPRLFRAAAPWVTAVSLIVPFIYGYVQDAVGRVLTGASSYMPWLVRAHEKASTLANRDYIWSQSISFYTVRVDWVHQAFGFGSYGQAESGASAYWGFSGFGIDEQLLTPHSSMLQIFFDGGWLIASIFAATIIYIAWVLSRRTSPIDLAGSSMLAALSIVGSTEVALSPGHAQPTWWVLLALSMIVFSRARPASHQTVSPDVTRQNEPLDLTGPNHPSKWRTSEVVS
jgi:hypothetical protein